MNDLERKGSVKDIIKREQELLDEGRPEKEILQLLEDEFEEKRIEKVGEENNSNEPNPNCPECKSKNVAWIFYGYPGDMEWYLEAIAKKEIVGGGCTVSNHDPKWRCNDCYHKWGEREND